jgi:organic radical activating enzyme
MIPYLAVHLADHCNLNCKGCDHFAPLADKHILMTEDIEEDFIQLSKKALIGELSLMGGEPLLNPYIEEHIELSRRYFPDTHIKVVTNGLLLLSREDSFWNTCRKHNIEIVTTKYPISNTYYDKCKKKAVDKDVKFSFYLDTGTAVKKSFKVVINPEGDLNKAEYNFKSCFHNNAQRRFLKAGRIYPCTIAPNIIHFNKFFGYDIPISEEDSIDIYSISSERDIHEFFNSPIPFCRYCNVGEREFNLDWERSKRKIQEWTNLG